MALCLEQAPPCGNVSPNSPARLVNRLTLKRLKHTAHAQGYVCLFRICRYNGIGFSHLSAP